ncbi:hypothetical protein BDW02DRAFT_575009 [Decorospora gaudefroyi]|uniref:WSC domain-containing protein n=1 Tax=Decorospora gaudefroyi TaxID=184978 RepID=A0A6A5K235_9PLEO|nr:hypothetical protein BDW02DRAFT_575009 [Decorospora gaudefroyi]
MTTYTTSGLTTAFTPAPSCYSEGLIGSAWAESWGTYITVINYNHRDDCYPYKTSLPYSYGTFSPGMCPGGYTTAAFTSRSSMVAAACCPSNYDNLDFDVYCTSIRTSSMSIDCLQPYDGPWLETIGCSPGLVGPGEAVQFAIHVQYASSDLEQFPTGYTPGGIGDNGAVTAAAFTEHVPGATGSVPTSDPTLSDTGTSGPTSDAADNNNGGLSGGAKAGTGIGVAVAVLALLGGIFLITRHRRKRAGSKESGGLAAPEDDGRYDDKEVVGPDHSPHPVYKHYHSELDGQASQMNELSGFQERRPQELPHEMPQSPPPHHVTPAPVVGTMPTQSAPAESDMTATALGPVSTQLHNSQYSSTSGNRPSQGSSTGSPQHRDISAQGTGDDTELKYLEDEERRIRERKEAILANRKAQ